jgi:hypothetical protein
LLGLTLTETAEANEGEAMAYLFKSAHAGDTHLRMIRTLEPLSGTLVEVASLSEGTE